MNNRVSWYKLVRGSELEQGDILFNLPVVELPVDFPWPLQEGAVIQSEPSVYSRDAIVISQSCDLQHPGKLEFVAFCPVYSFEDLGQFSKAGQRESLRQGRNVAYHLLDKCFIEYHERDYMIVEFKRIFSLPIDLAKRLAHDQGERLRLLSPYKEHLSQSFARFFMRVGLPSDIPPFK